MLQNVCQEGLGVCRSQPFAVCYNPACALKPYEQPAGFSLTFTAAMESSNPFPHAAVLPLVLEVFRGR